MKPERKDFKRIAQFEHHFVRISDKLEAMLELTKQMPDTQFAKEYYDIINFLQYHFCQMLCQLSHIEKPSKYSKYSKNTDNFDDYTDDDCTEDDDENSTFGQIRKCHTYMKDIDIEIAYLDTIANNISDKKIANEYAKIVNSLTNIYVQALNVLRSVTIPNEFID